MTAKASVIAAFIIAAFAATTAPSGAAVGAHARLLCGIERWAIKTLQDRPRLLPVQTVTLRFLVARPAPVVLPYRRLPFERHVFQVTAAVTEIRPEQDGDLHVILRDGHFHMIAEAPSLGCVAHAKLVRRVQMRAARRTVRVCHRARVTGVAFFDYLHGQIGVAPNGIELHPILRFRCLSG
jgi:hypothetical protein